MSDYAGFAWFYDRYWGRSVPAMFMDAIERFLVATLPAEAPAEVRLLDVCCGTGQLAAALAGRGYSVTGVDGSEEMLRYASVNAPDVQLIHADVRRMMPGEGTFDGAYSTFDSLNHLLSLEDLEQAFTRVHDALRPGAPFLFDLNMEEAYAVRWSGKMVIDEEEGACFVRFSYDREDRQGRCDVTMFRPAGEAAGQGDDCWRRSVVRLMQRCYSEQEVREALERAGMHLEAIHDGTRDLGMTGHTGRAFFVARRAA